MDFNELFNTTTVVKVRWGTYVTYHHLRTPTNEQDLEYRRRSAKINIKGRSVETTDQALNAPLFLYEAVLEKVLVENGNGEPAAEMPADVRARLPNRVKLEAINALLSDVERVESEETKNS